MILMSYNFEYKLERVKTDKNGNCIILDVNIQGKRITLVNLYGPNQDNHNFHTNIKQKVSEFENVQVIMCGNWKIASEYDQEIPQSQTADKPMAPHGRATQQSRDTRKTN